MFVIFFNLNKNIPIRLSRYINLILHRMNQKYHVQYIFPFLDIPSWHYIILALKGCVELIVNVCQFLAYLLYILLGALFQYFKICLISHDSVTTQSFENGGVDSAWFFTESTQSPTPTPTAGITINNAPQKIRDQARERTPQSSLAS